ncbi:MAG: tetratricopeptide repeat protein [Thermoplasmata archaeon]|nr:tetratricopeptide repeat protein [Thermoplasmata archaeon]
MPVQTYLPTEILDYVETHAPPADSAFGISQRELAKSLGYHPCSMSRPLADLVRDGLLNRQRGHVRGGERRQLVYGLTERGREKLKAQTRDVPVLSGDLPAPPNPFVGRKPELKELWNYSKEGGAIVFVQGSSGMGKTALVSRHVRRFRGGWVPFWFTIRVGSSVRQFTSALSHALAVLGAPQLAYYSQLPRQPVGREVADLAQRALGDRPLLAVVDDLQNADPDLKAFLRDMVQSLGPEHRHLFVLMGHDGPYFQPQRIATHHFVLGGLDRSAAHELTDRHGGLADRFESIYQATLGSPLLLQLSVTNPGLDASPQALPAAVVERLPLDEATALLPVAIAHEPLPLAFVRDTCGLESGRIDELRRMGIVQTTVEGHIELLQVVRAALIGRLGPIEEREAHIRLAAFYGRSHRPEAIRERFLHLTSGERWDDAVQVLTRHERALLALGYAEAFRSALSHMTLAMPTGLHRVRALRMEAMVLRSHSEYPEAILAFRRAILEATGDGRIEAECLNQIVDLYVRLHQVDEAERALIEARSRGTSTKRQQAMLLLSESRIVESRGDLFRAKGMFQETFDFARRSRLPDLELEAVAAWSRLAAMGGDHEAALRVVAQGLPEARQAGRIDIVLHLLLVRARSYAETGRREIAEQEMQAMRVEAESLGYLGQLAYTLSGLAAMATEAGRWAEGISYARQASNLAERLGNDLVLGHTLGLMASGETRQGLFQEAIQHAERSVTVLRRLPASDSLAISIAYLSEAYLASGELTLGKRYYTESLRVADSLGMPQWRESIERELGAMIAKLESAGGENESGTPN